jgi:hypothetical protein
MVDDLGGGRSEYALREEVPVRSEHDEVVRRIPGRPRAARA